VQALFEGHSATKSYELAGYRPNQGNSSRLKWYEMVQRRLSELQAAVAESTEITVESICAELDQATQVARANGQANAMVSASTLRAKLAGLLTDKVQMNVNQQAPSDDDIGGLGRWFAANYQDRGVILTQEQAIEFEQFLASRFEDIQQRLDQYAAVNAKPAHLERIERKRLGLAHSNGGQR
jgi:hypothetical protein